MSEGMWFVVVIVFIMLAWFLFMGGQGDLVNIYPPPESWYLHDD